MIDLKMNKIGILKYLEEYNLPKDEFVIFSGAALVLRNIKDSTNDVDLIVTENLENHLLNKYKNIKIDCYDEENGKKIYNINNNLNFTSNLLYILENNEYEIINGYKVQTIESIIKFKQKLNRPKDIKDIEIIKNYLNIQNINVLALAYLGDSIYELFIREHLLEKGIVKVKELQSEAINYVSARNQSNYLMKMIEENFFKEEEIDIIKRARNHKSHASKSTDIRTYKNSTGLEALIGYLYLNKQNERIKEIMKYIVGD